MTSFRFEDIDERMVGALMWSRHDPEDLFFVCSLKRQSQGVWEVVVWNLTKPRKLELRWCSTQKWKDFCVAYLHENP
jgi:hypothetical protein